MARRPKYEPPVGVRSGVQTIMLLTRFCLAKRTSVTAADVQGLLHCSRATSYRHVQDFRAVFPDRAAAQDAGVAVPMDDAITSLLTSTPAPVVDGAHDNVDVDHDPDCTSPA